MPKDATTCLLCAHYTEQGECQAHPPAMVPHLIQPAPEGGGAFLIFSRPMYPTPDPSYRCDEYAPAFRRRDAGEAESRATCSRCGKVWTVPAELVPEAGPWICAVCAIFVQAPRPEEPQP
jgi:hypothetical protein